MTAIARLLAPAVARYISAQRDRLAPLAAPLSSESRHVMAPHFPAADLDRVRILHADPLPIPDPPVSAAIRRLGFDFPSPALVAAITFDHVIAARAPMSDSLLFHELVHVVQFRVLGVRRFSFEYARGFLETRCYEGIPLERQAFELEARFARGEPAVDIAAEVAESFL